MVWYKHKHKSTTKFKNYRKQHNYNTIYNTNIKLTLKNIKQS